MHSVPQMPLVEKSTGARILATPLFPNGLDATSLNQLMQPRVRAKIAIGCHVQFEQGPGAIGAYRLHAQRQRARNVAHCFAFREGLNKSTDHAAAR